MAANYRCFPDCGNAPTWYIRATHNNLLRDQAASCDKHVARAVREVQDRQAVRGDSLTIEVRSLP